MRLAKVAGIAVVAVLCGGFFAAPKPSQAAWNDQRSISDTYYTIDGATITARVEATIKNATGQPLSRADFWAMPGASGVTVTQGGTPLTTKVTGAATGKEPVPALVTATLPNPIRPSAQADFVMTYTVAAQSGQLLKLSAGSMEGMLISQGIGSFVFVDVLSAAENYFDPGCLKTLDQPKEVAAAGRERWVCGEATILAFNINDHDLLKRCANLDERCRQSVIPFPFTAFMQSISDSSLRGSKEADVALANGPVKVTLRYFKTDEVWAKQQFDVAMRALPKIETLFNFPYTGKSILMRQSHHIEIGGAAGVAFQDEGTVLLASDTGFDEEVTVHELSHLWAAMNLSSSWLWEGLAEYSVRALAPSLGIKPIDRKWQTFGYNEPLSTWYHGSTVSNSDYWYGRSGAFWAAFETAVGGREKMRAVLGQIDDNPKVLPLDGKWFMDAGERVSGNNLDALFLQWVWNPQTAPALLNERRAVWDQLKPIRARAITFGLDGMPADVQTNLDAWTYANVPAQMASMTKIMDTYVEATQLATSAGLATPNPLAAPWTTSTLPQLQGIVDHEKQAAQAIIRAATAIPEGSAQQAGPAQIAKAVEAFAAADFTQVDAASAAALLAVKNYGAAAKLLEQATARKAAFKDGWLETVGLYFADPDADYSHAQIAFEAGDFVTTRKDAQAAIDSWNGAREHGLTYLAIAAVVVIAFSVLLVCFRPRHIPGRRRNYATVRFRSVAYEPPPKDSRPASSWRDWTNNP